MSLKDFAENNKPAAIGLFFASMLLVAGVFAYPSIRKALAPKVKPPESAYYYDIVAAKIITGPYSLPGPIGSDGTPDGSPKNAYRAYVYGCGDCFPVNQFVGLIFRLNADATAKFDALAPEVKATFVAPPLSPMALGIPMRFPLISNNQGVEIARTSTEPKWQALNSKEAKAIIAVIGTQCGQGKRTIECNP